jgi:hypothetical protein
VTKEGAKPHLSWHLIENRLDQRAEIKEELLRAFGISFLTNEPCVFDNMESCLRYLQKTGERPTVVIADLYDREDKTDIKRVLKVIINERIPLLTRLRQVLGSKTILIVLTRYKNFFTEEQQKAEIEDALLSAPVDGVVDKIPKEEESDWVSDILKIVKAHLEIGEKE